MKEFLTFSYLMDRAVKAERLDLNHRFKKQNIDITPDQWHILTILNDHENGLSQNEVAANAFKDAPTVSRIIDLLVKKGYVSRLPYEGDRRRYKVVINEKGLAIFHKAKLEVEENVRTGWTGLNEEDLACLERVAKKVYNNYSN